MFSRLQFKSSSSSSQIRMVNKYGGSQVVLSRLNFHKEAAVSDWVEFADVYKTDAFRGSS